jgi:hypothetical protein
MADKLHHMGGNQYVFHCPGCGCGHALPLYVPDPNGQVHFANHPGWTWNGSMDRPTFSPSILVHSHPQYELPDTPRCHSFVNNGTIQFLADCSHPLANKQVEIPDWDE